MLVRLSRTNIPAQQPDKLLETSSKILGVIVEDGRLTVYRERKSRGTAVTRCIDDPIIVSGYSGD